MTNKRSSAEAAPETDLGDLTPTVLIGAGGDLQADARFRPTLSIAALFESPNNPRKRFDAEGLEELTTSIREKGVLTPLLARPVPGWDTPAPHGGRRYEIAAGHRRYRAAQAAGLHAVPVLAREMTDTELLEVLVIENDQRADVHPLEEAAGYQALVRSAGYDVARIAERVGRSVKYVYDRIKLLTLTKDAQKLFLDGKFAAGHAILLARLSPADQARAIAGATNVDEIDHRRPALFTDEQTLFDPRAGDDDGGRPVKAVSVKEFQAWIDEHVKFDREKVDPMLFPESFEVLKGAQEHPLKVVPITHDYRASDDVRQESKERVYGEKSWKRADGKRGSKECDRSRVGVVVCGAGRGEAFLICVNKDLCKVHWSKEQREKKRRQAGATKSDRTSIEARRELDQKHKEQRAREEAERGRWEKARPAILQAVAAAVQKAPTKATGILGKILMDGIEEQRYGVARRADASLVPLGRTAEDLVRHATFILLAQDSRRWDAPQFFPKRARAFGIDVRKILDQAAPAKVRACRFCGCTEDNACPGGCAWLGKVGTPLADVCSTCLGRLSKKERGLCDLHGGPAPVSKGRKAGKARGKK